MSETETKIAAALDAAGIPGGVDLHQRVMVAVVRMQTAEEHRDTMHRQVAEIAAVLDPEVCPDAWRCHEAAQKRMRELATLKSELADAKRDLHSELLCSDASHRLLDECGVEKDSGPDEMPPGAVLNVTDRIRRLDAKHGRRMAGAKQAVDAVRRLQRKAEDERDAFRAQVEALATAGERLEQQHLAAAKESEEPLRTAYRYAAGSAKVLGTMARDARSASPAETMPSSNSPEIPDGSPSESDFVTVRNTLAGSPGSADYNGAFNALLRLGLKARKWDAALARADDTEGQRRIYFERGIKNATLGNLVRWMLHGDEAKETP